MVRELDFTTIYPPVDDLNIRRAIETWPNVEIVHLNGITDETLINLSEARNLRKLTIYAHPEADYAPTTLPITTLEISTGHNSGGNDTIYNVLSNAPNITKLQIEDGYISANGSSILKNMTLEELEMKNVNLNIFEIETCITAVNAQSKLTNLRFIFTNQWEKHIPALEMSLRIIQNANHFLTNLQEITFTDNNGHVNLSSLTHLTKLANITIYTTMRSTHNTIGQLTALKKEKTDTTLRKNIKIKIIEFIEEDNRSLTKQDLKRFKIKSDEMAKYFKTNEIEFIQYEYNK